MNEGGNENKSDGFIDCFTHIDLIFEVARLQIVQQRGLVQEHQLTWRESRGGWVRAKEEQNETIEGLTVVIVILFAIAGGEYIVHGTDALRFVGLQRLHLKLVAAANLRYSALYVALAVVTHPHRLSVHDSSAAATAAVAGGGFWKGSVDTGGLR